MQTKEAIKEILYYMGYVLPIVCIATMYTTFYWCFFLTDYTFAVNIGAFGEAVLEAVILPIFLGLTIRTSVIKFRKFKKELK